MTFNQLQFKASDLLFKDDSSITDYLSLAKQLVVDFDNIPPYFRKIKVAFLSNFTLKGMPEVFKIQALVHNIYADVYLGEYDQYTQEVLNLESNFYKFKPDLIYLLIDELGVDNDQINELVNILLNKGFKVKLIWGNTIKETFNSYWYTKYKDLGDFRLAPQAFSVFVNQELMKEAIAISGTVKKCLVVDLDNTLWQGIVGETNYNDIKPEQDLQRHILELYNRGIILAINSRNNYEDSLPVISKHPDMILRVNNFAAIKINWKDKTENITELAQELNIGLDSFVFIDDDPFQRENVKSKFSEITVLAPEKLTSYIGFNSSVLTEEDKKRGQMYLEENKRKDLQSSLTNVEDFLKQLDLRVEIELLNSSNLTRVSQLTQKTNQFNLTTRRYMEEEVTERANNGWKIWTLSAKDRFGDYGIVGVCIVEPKDSEWRIDSFLLSCRILGREVERSFLGHIIKEAKNSNVNKILGEFIPTNKNKPCSEFYAQSGFDLLAGTKESLFYEFTLKKDYLTPDFIKIFTS